MNSVLYFVVRTCKIKNDGKREETFNLQENFLHKFRWESLIVF